MTVCPTYRMSYLSIFSPLEIINLVLNFKFFHARHTLLSNLYPPPKKIWLWHHNGN